MGTCNENQNQEQNNRCENEQIDDVTAKIRRDLFYKHVWPHRNLVFKLCINYTEYQEDIEDNYNEALTNFYKYIESYDPKKSIQTWLHIITKRLVYDRNAKNRQHRNEYVNVEALKDIYAVGYEGYGLLYDTGENQEITTLELNEEYQEAFSDDVMTALLSLNPIYREAILLQLQGYKIKDMVEICHKRGTLKTKNHETMKSRLWQAKQQLQNLIDRNGNLRNKTNSD